MNIEKNNLNNLGYNYLVKNGIFTSKNFFNEKDFQIINNIYNGVNLYINIINHNISKEYDNYYVEEKNTLQSSNNLNLRNKTTFNFRGISKNKIINQSYYEYDNGFCDITKANLLFYDINKLDFTEIFKLCKKLKPDFNSNKDIMYNIYYTNSVIDTRTWHKDGNIIKFFIYLQDVNLENGPYSYIINSNNNLIKLDKNKEISDNNLNLILKKHNFFKKYIIEGKKGDMICSNQNGIHRGQEQKLNSKRIILVLRLFNL